MRGVLAALIAAFFCANAHAGSLPHSTLSIATKHGFHVFRVEVAADQATQEKGLMYRRHMAPDAGMLFDFHAPSYVTFWMKNTLLPLDMIFIRQDGTIASIAANAEPESLNQIKSPEAVRAVLEINGGRAAALGIEPGARVKSAIFPGH